MTRPSVVAAAQIHGFWLGVLVGATVVMAILWCAYVAERKRQ